MGLLNSPKELIDDFYKALGLTREELFEITSELYVELEQTLDVQEEEKALSWALTYKSVGGILIITGFLDWSENEEEIFSRDDVLLVSGEVSLHLLRSQLEVFC